MSDVIVFGPNISFADGATFHVHAVGCQHLRQRPYSLVNRNSDQGGWTLTGVSTQAEVVEEIYPPEEFEDETGDDITVFPCCGLI
jgi:hypothetical protein